jgi:hypothetical protein
MIVFIRPNGDDENDGSENPGRACLSNGVGAGLRRPHSGIFLNDMSANDPIHDGKRTIRDYTRSASLSRAWGGFGRCHQPTSRLFSA